MGGTFSREAGDFVWRKKQGEKFGFERQGNIKDVETIQRENGSSQREFDGN